MGKVYWIVLVAGMMVLGWYLFIKPFEFEVTFEAKTLPGDIVETIRIWNRTLGNAEIVDVDSIYSLKQRIVRENRTYIYDWHFIMINDSTTKVSIEITEPSNVLMNKLAVPFANPPIEQDAGYISTEFYRIIKEHLSITNVKIDGEVELPSTFCACTTKETDQMDKANGMMTDFGLITSFIDEFELEADGPPVVRVLVWNHNLGKLKYDFCFPVVKRDTLPMIAEITYKEIEPLRVLKATYHGNYITSDRAWYYLIYYAQTRGYKINGLPIEYFYNNPNLGMNESEWKAEIFLPIK